MNASTSAEAMARRSQGDLFEPMPVFARDGRRMHRNSLSSFFGDRGALSKRAQEVLAFVRRNGPCMDREIMEGMGFSDMNAVRPRITELVKARLLVECGKRRSALTGKMNRVVRAGAD